MALDSNSSPWKLGLYTIVSSCFNLTQKQWLTYLVIFFYLLEVFLVDELENRDRLPLLILFVVLLYSFLHTVPVGHHFRTVAVDWHDHYWVHVLTVSSVVNWRREIGQALNVVLSDYLSSVVYLAGNADRVAEFVPGAAFVLSLEIFFEFGLGEFLAFLDLCFYHFAH